MRRLLSALIAASLAALCIPVHAQRFQALSPADELIYSRFGDYLEALRVQIGIPGLAVAVIGKTDVQWSRGFGYSDVERQIAMRTDTPLHLDGITESFTATLLLRCVEEGRLSLEEKMGAYRSAPADADLTIRQVLTHTSGPYENLTYAFRPDRFEPMPRIIRACSNDSFRKVLGGWTERFGMQDTVPGADSVQPNQLTEGVPTPEQLAHYSSVLTRLAKPYAVDSQRRATPSEYSSTALTPTTGVIASVLDYAQYDLALKNGTFLRNETLSAAWRAPSAANGTRLPHAIGWFAQTYGIENVVWQFGTGDSGSSSFVAMLPGRGITVVMAANSTGLAKTFQLSNGDLTTSPFGRLFLSMFVR